MMKMNNNLEVKAMRFKSKEEAFERIEEIVKLKGMARKYVRSDQEFDDLYQQARLALWDFIDKRKMDIEGHLLDAEGNIIEDVKAYFSRRVWGALTDFNRENSIKLGGGTKEERRKAGRIKGFIRKGEQDGIDLEIEDIMKEFEIEDYEEFYKLIDLGKDVDSLDFEYENDEGGSFSKYKLVSVELDGGLIDDDSSYNLVSVVLGKDYTDDEVYVDDEVKERFKKVFATENCKDNRTKEKVLRARGIAEMCLIGYEKQEELVEILGVSKETISNYFKEYIPEYFIESGEYDLEDIRERLETSIEKGEQGVGNYKQKLSARRELLVSLND